MRLIRSSDYRRMPWKNGGGETIEIAIWPPQASVADFDWRISMAKVASDGPFSPFPGIDRTLVVLQGEGLVLTVGDAPATRLTVKAPPFSFPGDIATRATLISGEITDFNVMTRRGLVGHRVQRLEVGPVAHLDAGLGARIIFCASGAVRVRSSAAAIALGEAQTLLCAGEALEIEAARDQSSEIIVVDLG